MARLDQLPAAKEVAQLAAVLGRAFTYDLVRSIAQQDEDTLQAGLAQLVAAKSSISGDGRRKHGMCSSMR